MGKQAKKKDKSDAQAAKQKHHNKATRGINTRRRGVLWSLRQRRVKDKEGNEEIRTEKVYVEPNTMYDPFDKAKNDPSIAHEPFDALHLDWREHIMHYVADNEARMETINLGNETFLYRVFKETPGGNREVLFEVQSAKKFIIERKARRTKRA